VIFTDIGPFHAHLNRYAFADICTFTIGRPYTRLKIRRLIYDEVLLRAVVRAQEARYLRGVHAKIYICWLARKSTVFVGSANFSDSERHELIIEVTDKKIKHAVMDYYEELWSLAQPSRRFLDEVLNHGNKLPH
jgi:hypothetical protein